MKNNTKKCKSKCIHLPKNECYKGCVFTKKGFCKLSSRYQMDNKTCKLMKRSKYIPKSFKIPKKKNEPISSSYSPEINKYLIQSRYSPKYDIFSAITNCMNIDINNYSINDSILKYYSNPRIQLKDGQCVSYWQKESQDMFLDNLSKHNRIDIHNLIVPKQSLYNCWFNTGFMINYVSDKGRKFNKFFRQFMITGKVRGLKPFLNKLKAPLFLFNIAIEATLQGDTLAKIMNTNDIIEKIYKNIPKEYKKSNPLANKLEYGNPYDYQMSLLNYLSEHKRPYNFVNGYSILKDKMPILLSSDVLYMEISEKHSKQIDNKTISLKTKENIYEIDSILLRDITGNHFCCLITLNDKEYMYDGAEEPSIVRLNWKNNDFLNTNKTFKMNETSSLWNMRKGYQVLNYYQV